MQIKVILGLFMGTLRGHQIIKFKYRFGFSSHIFNLLSALGGLGLHDRSTVSCWISSVYLGSGGKNYGCRCWVLCINKNKRQKLENLEVCQQFYMIFKKVARSWESRTASLIQALKWSRADFKSGLTFATTQFGASAPISSPEKLRHCYFPFRLTKGLGLAFVKHFILGGESMNNSYHHHRPSYSCSLFQQKQQGMNRSGKHLYWHME